MPRIVSVFGVIDAVVVCFFFMRSGADSNGVTVAFESRETLFCELAYHLQAWRARTWPVPFLRAWCQ